MREDKLARLMFYGGCAFLPWLWCVNVMYFRKKVYGPIPVWDTWLFRSDGEGSAAGAGSAIDGVPALGAIASDDDDEEDEDGGEFNDEHSLPPESLNEEVAKWVKRSTCGAAGVLSLLVAWVVTFQVNRDSFPPSWFVMDEDEGEMTGW
mmetsp:Transcript_19225/g.35876  ORF Transcript_19225/g.35876 Transcript_19225/m.35876 type:complete len:149 (-) Transcript_19225:52-498(-)|eukprot:CAMPEP_0197441882 /NCGR_PEP_ID=MMETSP1175-20131217/8030_1 /TAXON_ID=1003142 /ORGANISM="Triceratium dubium, Strain CCMP147" /LENGTH=148 /DNA_ID=CAMNT_0042972241 /DNA_START=312 /DNA_END=758 /DNA_ORIENTATION=+